MVFFWNNTSTYFIGFSDAKKKILNCKTILFSSANIEDWPPRLSSDLLDWPRITDYDYDGPSEQHLQTEKPSELGLGSYIFNRRGRLDVKKPGPFYPNSANNFFLDKVSCIYLLHVYKLHCDDGEGDAVDHMLNM